MRVCEDTYAVGDSVVMCRFTTKLFNSPSLPGLEEFQQQLANVTGLQFTREELDRAGQNIMGVERMINYRLGVRRKDDTLPDRWFDEPNTAGPFKGEHIDRDEFAQMLSRFYELSELTDEGVPREPWRSVRNLLIYRVLGAYGWREYARLLRPRARGAMRLLAAFVALLPGVPLHAAAVLYCRVTRSAIPLLSLRNSRFAIRRILSNRRSS